MILDYRERDAEEWGPASRCVFSDPEEASNEFLALRACQSPAYAVLEAFREWRCTIPTSLLSIEAVFLMDERDFIEL